MHLDGNACRVRCEFCYLGARTDAGATEPDLALLERLLATLPYDELALAVSEPVALARKALTTIQRVTRSRGLPLAVTTTLAIAQAHPELFDGAQRVNLSVDPEKGRVVPAHIDALAATLKARRTVDVVLIASLVTPAFASELVDRNLLARLVDLPAVDKVALNALKPPPSWCDRKFWLAALARLRPLLARALDTRLYLDCYVAARLLGLGPCPARADLSPAQDGLAFRACVYQPTAEWVVTDAQALAERLRGFVPPAACPFPTV